MTRQGFSCQAFAFCGLSLALFLGAALLLSPPRHLSALQTDQVPAQTAFTPVAPAFPLFAGLATAEKVALHVNGGGNGRNGEIGNPGDEKEAREARRLRADAAGGQAVAERFELLSDKVTYLLTDRPTTTPDKNVPTPLPNCRPVYVHTLKPIKVGTPKPTPHHHHKHPHKPHRHRPKSH